MISTLRLIALTLPLLAGTIGNCESWPRWRGPRGDGTWQGPKLPAQWPKAGPPVVWKQPLGGGFAGVVVADGRAITMDRQTKPREVERVVCHAAATGKLLWKHEYPVRYGKLSHGTGPRAAPTIHQGRVYTLGAMGHACALDAASGRRIWSIDTVKELRAKLPEWGFAASPVMIVRTRPL